MKRTWNNIIYLFIFFAYLFGAPLMICQSDAIDILFTGIRNNMPKAQNIEPEEEAISCSESLYSELAPCNTSRSQLVIEDKYPAIIRSRHSILKLNNLNESPYTKEQVPQNYLKNIGIQRDTLKR